MSCFVNILAKSKTCTDICRLLVQIHDELLYEVPDEDVPLVSRQLKEIAESPNLLEGYCQPLRVSDH